MSRSRFHRLHFESTLTFYEQISHTVRGLSVAIGFLYHDYATEWYYHHETSENINSFFQRIKLPYFQYKLFF